MKMHVFLWSAAVLSLTMAVRSRGGQPPATGSPPPLVAHEELQKRLADPALRLIDARPRADYDGGHIPGAVWLDPKVFEPLTRGEAATDRAAWGRVLAPLGVGPDTEILVYDDDRYHLQAGRVWFWLSYAADARAVGLIDGRFSSWKRAGRPVSTGETRVTARNVGVTFRPGLLASRQDVQTATLLRDFPTRRCAFRRRVSRQGGLPDLAAAVARRQGRTSSVSQAARGRQGGARGRHIPGTRGPAHAHETSRDRGRPADHRLFQGGARSNAIVFALRRLGVPVRHYVSGLNEWASDPTLPLVTTSEPLGAN